MKHLKESLQTLQAALKATIEAARRDDKTPLLNAIALGEIASSVGGEFHMSFGYIATDEVQGTDFQVLLDRAELACQHAKKEGDGVCVGWTEQLQEQALLTIRRRCEGCNTTITCSIPKESTDKAKTLNCPVCNHELPTNEISDEARDVES